jgi:alkyldihydroxyacetonephosphate synthase
MTPMAFAEIESVASGRMHRDPATLDAYSLDVWCPAMMHVDRGILYSRPECVVLPADAAEIAAILKIANNHNVPVTPHGGGAGDSGCAIPAYGGIVMDLKGLDRVLSIDETSLSVTCQTGMYQSDLEEALNDRGYTTNHLPASGYCSTVGGFLSTRGSGVLSSKYGKIEDLVLAMEVVFPNGAIGRTPPIPEHSAGPDFNRLFLGAEGTLGVITEVTLQIYPLPVDRRFRGFLFSELSSALEAGRRIMTQGLDPCVIRTYDEDDARVMAKNVLGIERDDIGGWMIIGFDGQHADIVELQEQHAMRICEELGGEDLGRAPGERWWNHRYDFYYPPHTLESKHYLYGVTDTIASYRDIESVYQAMREALHSKFAAYDIHFGGHFSHWYEWGTSFYPNFIVREPPEDAYEAMRLYNDIFETSIGAAMAHGGLLNEHHGIGLKLGRLMKRQFGEIHTAFQRIKSALDPNNILNPGKMGLSAGRFE